MLRQLLTLLAVITGLAATGDVAQARMTSVENVALESVALAGSDCIEQRPATVVMLTQGARERTTRPACKPSHPVVSVPTVMLRADRSRE